MQSVCVFCGSSSGADPIYVDVADRLGKLLAAEGITLVYGGACVGLMGAVADATLAAGGKAIGVLPDFLRRKELAYPRLTELFVVSSMHERKARMAELADGFIALPGGMGTLEEFCEIITWAQLGLHQKPCCLLNVQEYYEPLLRFVDRMAGEGFLKEQQKGLVLSAPTPEEALTAMRGFEPVIVPKWVDRKERA
ncbi:LOG family protein [Solidesulfovibrio carbinolicus]|uniref:Cytokinin riboside 5'-monophosphate phosphoribohydrolase n=1 Tax=Solidesulfovibrio carbinolicus TaxID=296842 RepID=A0A4P6HKT3_9BACT|nr:TIGR00730 family Rossman fold protein [Solidesulfovibrio carbinolicus]QAZ67793.1 TIGR00730 family Rossman fold protein [Solidesulfovibrio carbinolicus]